MQKVYFILLMVILFSCQNKKTADGFLTTESGFKYKIISSATAGDSIRTDDVVKLHFMQFIDDSLLNDTHNTKPEYVKMDSTLRNFEYTEILKYMKVNDSVVCIFPVKEILKRSAAETHPPHFLENRKNINLYVKIIGKFGSDSLGARDFLLEKRKYDSVVAVKEKAGYEEAERVFDSLIQSVKAPLRALPNGVFVQLMEKRTGEKIRKGDSIAVVYKGTLANGNLFEETNAQKPYLLRAGELESVAGFDTGIASLNYGDKAKIFVPARLAYGANPAGKDIPPFSNLIFEVMVNKH